MTDQTKRGLRALVVGILLILAGMALHASDSETLKAIAVLVDLMGGVLVLIGIVLGLVGLFRKS